ncbi:NUDIX domain-containing protein [Phenylobacterium sp.]|uniref:NUDIX domain-containing protein n=1 Tax=Phenylobacterium sp. TaxID=1871053 RepID=UPI002E332B45|nr:NUDIX domain-containing protein [Phenylobacterium sp.]HEX2560411.1 NUDIX domain-containing protein [Phenylobacterium sp.]
MGSTRTSAGLLVWRRGEGGIEFLLAHPGGPLWAKRDAGAWMIPKGEIDEGEDPLACAVREFEEEVGQAIAGPFEPLTPIRQKGGKRVVCWLAEADLDLAGFRSNTFRMEWPPRSGRMIEVPEIDKVAYWPAEAAMSKLLPSQAPLVVEALARLGP